MTELYELNKSIDNLVSAFKRLTKSCEGKADVLHLGKDPFVRLDAALYIIDAVKNGDEAQHNDSYEWAMCCDEIAAALMAMVEGTG